MKYNVEKQKLPNTAASLKEDLQRLGLREGMTVIVHSSLKSLGWVCGGPVAVVNALMETVGKEGTIVMPTQSADLSDPSFWENPPVPEEWWETIRQEMPAFDPRTTPTLGMGSIVECFRTYEGVTRSYHPTTSFAAWGKHKAAITSEQSLSYSLGEESPLQKLYDLNAYVLLLGVGYGNNTSLHLAEHYANSCFTFRQCSPIMEEGKRVWKEYEEFIYDVDSFPELGKEYEQKHEVSIGYVGKAESRLMPQRELVDFAKVWFEARKIHY